MANKPYFTVTHNILEDVSTLCIFIQTVLLRNNYFSGHEPPHFRTNQMQLHMISCPLHVVITKGGFGDFPGGPVVKIPCFHFRGHGSIPGQGTKIPHAV